MLHELVWASGPPGLQDEYLMPDRVLQAASQLGWLADDDDLFGPQDALAAKVHLQALRAAMTFWTRDGLSVQFGEEAAFNLV